MKWGPDLVSEQIITLQDINRFASWETEGINTISMSWNKKKPRFESKFLHTKKRYNKIDFSAW